MEQTPLPDGVSPAEINIKIGSKNMINYLTSGVNRVMNTIVIKKEADNANRKQKSNQGNQTDRSIPQTELLLRGRGECGREAPLPLTGRAGIQESLSGGEGHHRTCLRRLGLLEHTDRRDYHAESRKQNGDRVSRGNCRGNQSNSRADYSCTHCHKDRPQENRGLSGTQSEGCAGRSDSVVLPGLRQELHCIGSRNTGDLPGKASGEITLPDKRITICEQAPNDGGLFCVVVKKTSIAPRLAMVVFASLFEHGRFPAASPVASLIGSLSKYPSTVYGGYSC